MATDPREAIAGLSSTLLTVEKVMNLDGMRTEIADLETQASADRKSTRLNSSH